MKTVPFWVDDAPRPPGITGALPSEADCVIVGSGFTGLSAALRLADAGRSVVILDSGEIAGGASSMNGGMVSPDVKAGIDTVEDRFGPAIADEMWASTVRSTGLVRALDQRTQANSITHQGGMAGLARGRKAASAYQSEVAWYRERFGVEREVITGSDVASIVGGDYFDVGVFEPEGYGIHPARLAFGMAAEAKKLGIVMVDRCEATSITSLESGPTVHTPAGDVRAGEVILATNGYVTSRPSSGLAKLFVPIGSYIIVTEPLGDRAREIFPKGSMSYTRKRLLNYMRLTHDNRVLIGGRRNLKTDLDLDDSARDLRQSLLEFWPQLAHVSLTHVWGGKLGIPFDLIPHIGQVDGAWYAGGYGGHGVGLSSQLGYELAGMILGEDPPSVYSRIPHKGRPYYSGGSPWFLTPASLMYRTLDKVGL